MNKEKYSVPAIDNTVNIFQYLSKDEHAGGKTLSEIAEATGLGRSTCFRLLQALLKYNLVAYNPSNKTYKLGYYLTFLGNKSLDSLFDIKMMQPFLEKAAQITNQTCIISQRFSENQVIYVAKQESPQHFRINVSLGQQRPITNTAMGKCFLAYLENKEVEDVIRSCGGLTPSTPRTIVDMDAFFENLRLIRSRGYSISIEECLLGVDGAAAPIFDQNGRVCYVLSLSCLHAQVSEDKLHEYGTILKEIADQISEAFLKHYETSSGSQPLAGS